ncbi:MAG: hypothetical protein BWZ10_01756 [candidate division BRC1 bacterium ADurb.BinA364]|nr:MAG: hypothetical protein BWZ10_01756 [candidate division BRC1 bacterium ADurb.BinA364]
MRDPEWLFAYWEISDQDRLRHNLNQAGPDRRMALRVWDVSAGNGHGNGASHYDIVVTEFAESWYLHVAAPNRQWRVELGLLAPNGEFIAIASSNTVATPRSSVSDAVDEAWMRVDEERFEQVFRLSGGETRPSSAGASEEIEAGMGARLKRRILPQYLLGASEQLAAASEMRASEEAMRKREAPEGAAPFHLRVDCELVLYGATEADARVTVCGQPVALRPDGSFTLRFALPDGEFELPVKAVKSSGDQQREITPEVKRQTK